MRKLFRLSIGLAIASAVGTWMGDEAQARSPYRVRPVGLFSNLYSDGPATPAQMYPSPLTTVPEWVGHTYYTYEPLAPQAWLNPHARRYFRSDSPLGLPTNYTRVEFW